MDPASIIAIITTVYGLGTWLVKNLPTKHFDKHQLRRTASMIEFLRCSPITDNLYYPGERKQWQDNLTFVKDKLAEAKARWEVQEQRGLFAKVAHGHTIKKVKKLMADALFVLANLESSYHM
jgi:hypothetical protein